MPNLLEHRTVCMWGGGDSRNNVDTHKTLLVQAGPGYPSPARDAGVLN